MSYALASSGLTVEDFTKLQDFITDAPKSLKEVVQHEFSENGILHAYDPEKPIDFHGFSIFLTAYLGETFPESVKVNLFLSFMRRISVLQPVNNQALGLDGADAKKTGTISTASGGRDGTYSVTGASVPTPSRAKTLTRSITAAGISSSNLFAGLSERLVGRLHALGKTGSPISSSTIDCQNDSSPSRPVCSLGSISAQSQPSLLLHTVEEGFSEQLHSRCSSKKSIHSLHHSGCKLDQEVIWRPRVQTKALPSTTIATNICISEQTALTEPTQIIKSSDCINMKDLLCYLSLLESGRPEDKLEFMFRLYDSDDNGVLDKSEMDCIINQMMNVAKYLEWDTQELRPILMDLMDEIDYDADGEVSLEEWKRGGMTNVPLLVLLGLDVNVRDDGKHAWQLKHFRSQSVCCLCHKLLGGFGRQGLSCTFCKYTVHERCAKDAPASCISTYTKSKKSDQQMEHHWVEANIPVMRNNCARCRKATGMGDKIAFHCRWCSSTVHRSCIPQWKPFCDFGELHEHILPPSAIFPAVLERKPTSRRPVESCNTAHVPHEENVTMETTSDMTSECGNNNDSTTVPPASPSGVFQDTNVPYPQSPQSDSPQSSFQMCIPPGCHPLLVFINPKSGGKQGLRILRKFQYLLNPRQVYDLIADGGPSDGLRFFRDVPGARILAAGGDGTVGWLLEAMDKMEWSEDQRPPVAVLPLGTGNDLARCLRWGGGYENESLAKVLHRIAQGTVVMLDRWKIECSKPPHTRGILRRSSSSRSQCFPQVSSARTFTRESVTKKISLGSAVGTTGEGNPIRTIQEQSVSRATTFSDSALNDEQVSEHLQQHHVSTAVCGWGDGPVPISALNVPSPSLLLDEDMMGDEMPLNIINNYFSIGVDASIAHKFHMMREKHPERFNSRMRNRIFYMEFGTSEIITSSCKNLHEYIDIICDGVALDLRQGTPLEGIAVLNIHSVYGGSNLWGGGGSNSVISGSSVSSIDSSYPFTQHQSKRKKEYKRQMGPHKKNKKKSGRGDSPPRKDSSSYTSDSLSFAVQDMGDHLLEVVGLENAMHAGLVAGGLRSSGKRLSQCRELVIRTQKRFPMQIDGEPWMQTPCTISITHKNQVPMIMAPTCKKSSFFSHLFRK